MLGIADICSILGCGLSIYLMFKTHSISKTLNRIKVSKRYNRERKAFIEKFKGYQESIISDGNTTRRLVSDILTDLAIIETVFSPVLSIWDKCKICAFQRLLRGRHEKIDFQKVSQLISNLIGRLSKKEDLK